MKIITVEFIGIDDWNRPIFKDTNDKRYFGDTENLFDYFEENNVIDFYSNENKLNQLTYFGRSFNCEPLGISLKVLDVTLKLKN